MTVKLAPLEHLHICEALQPRAMSVVMTMAAGLDTPGHLPPLVTRAALDDRKVMTEARMPTHRAITTVTLPRSPEEEASPRIETLAANILAVTARSMIIDHAMTITSVAVTAIRTEVAIVQETAPRIVRETEGTDREIGPETDPRTDPGIEIASTTAIAIVEGTVIVTKTVIVIVIVTAIATVTAMLESTILTTVITVTDKTRLSGLSISQVLRARHTTCFLHLSCSIFLFERVAVFSNFILSP